MNIEFLPEGDRTLKTDSDRLEAEAAVLQSPPVQRRGKKVLFAVIILSCLMLCTVSLVLHTTAIKTFIDNIGEGGKNMLIRLVLPGIEVKGGKGDKPSSGDSGEESEKSGGDGDIAQYVSMDLSSDEGALSISNETSYAPDLAALSAAARPVAPASAIRSEYGESAPLVLIYHTHGTEAYADCAESSFRSSDTSKNVVAVGSVLCSVLEDAGIGCVHLEEMFDSENWSAAYDTSTVAVREVLDKNPSIKYIFDIHRDCIGSDDSGYVRSRAEYCGMDVAQLMFVCGTNQGGSSHTSWQNNLTFAAQLQEKLWQKNPGLMRPIDLRCASFYQDTGAGAMLIEFGTCANSLDEAKRSAVLFGACLADYIYGEEQNINCSAIIEKFQ